MAKDKRNATIAWLERSNPLRGLSIAQANAIFDAARNGDTQRLHWIYQEIEAQNPVLSMATTRRAGAAANFKWRITERAAMDGALSSEQKDAAERFFAEIDNFSDVFEHLDLALFRGFAHAQPIWEDGPDEAGPSREGRALSRPRLPRVPHIELLDSWKFLKKDGEWLFNPACDGFSSNCVSCKDARLITVERRRPVDVPALAIHLRAAVGSRDWGRFIERYALPKPAVVMAPNATKKDRDDYEDSAVALENGQVTVWPSGASLMDFAGSSRGVDPFTSFITHQEKTILMLATGGTLGSMAESGAGTLAGNAQQDVWDQIVSRDAGILAASVQRSMLRPFIASVFPGRPLTVDFDFDLTIKPTPKEVFETAAAAKSAGYLVAQDVLEEETGWKLEKDTAPEGGFGGQKPSGFALNSQTPLQNDENGLQNAPRVSDGQGHPSGEDALVEALSGLFEKSLAEAAAEAVEGEVENAITKPCPKCHRQMSDDGTCSFCESSAATQHTPEEQKRIEDFKASTNQSVVDTTNEIVDIFENGKPLDKVSKMHANFGTVSDQSAEKISSLLGYDVSGYETIYDGSDILHTWERHGRNGKADQSMADVANFGRAGYVVDHADSIVPLTNPDGTPNLGNFLDKSGKKSPKLMARMKINGTAATTIVAPDSKKKRIHIISMRIEKSNPADVKHQVNLPRPTSETVSTGHKNDTTKEAR